MRALIIDDTARAEAARVVAYAMDHPFFSDRKPLPPAPGDDPNHVAMLDTYRAVFSFTHHHGKVFRHLTLSIPRLGMYPNAVAAFHIAQLFGFTGYDGESAPRKIPETWIADAKDGIVMLAQEC